ncbi:MAG TPA: hypothetical protein VJB65_03120 [Patescibacteria group bacterium]|nr:hypothetical protein [Patescibacteria group bacterium]
MKKNNIVRFLLVAVICGGAGFLGGMKYQQSTGVVSFKNFANISQEERQQKMQEYGMPNGGVKNAGGRMMAGPGNGGLVRGEILSTDEQSIVIKLPDGGSKIVYYSDATQLSQSTTGSLSDLVTGTSVAINGDANDDGSVSATTIQISPITPPAINQ